LAAVGHCPANHRDCDADMVDVLPESRKKDKAISVLIFQRHPQVVAVVYEHIIPLSVQSLPVGEES